MNITVTIRGLVVGEEYHTMEAQPEESLVSIVDRIDTDMEEFTVSKIKFNVRNTEFKEVEE